MQLCFARLSLGALLEAACVDLVLEFGLIHLFEAEDVLREVVRSYVLRQRHLDVLLADQLQQGLFQLLHAHLFALAVEQAGEVASRDFVGSASSSLDQRLERLLNIVLANTVDGSVVHKQSDESVETDVCRGHGHLSELTVLHLINNVLDLLLSRVIAHRSHQVR